MNAEDQKQTEPLSMKRLSAVGAFIALLAVPIGIGAVNNDRVNRHEDELRTLRAKIEAQSDVLWEIRADVKTLKERRTP